MKISKTFGALAAIGAIAASTLAIGAPASAATDANPDVLVGKWVMDHPDVSPWGMQVEPSGLVRGGTGYVNIATEISIPAIGKSGPIRILDGDWRGYCIGPNTDANPTLSKAVECDEAPTVTHRSDGRLFGSNGRWINGPQWHTSSSWTIVSSYFSEAPATAEVEITSPAAGETVESLTPTFAGKGEPGASVVVRDAEGNELGSTIVGEDGEWALTVEAPMTEGPSTITVEQTDANGDTTTATVEFIVADGEGAPAIQPLMAGGAGMLAAIAAAGVFVRRRAAQRA